MKKVKLVVFGLVPTLMMFLVSCSVPTVRTVGKEQHTGIIYILELTRDSMVFKGDDNTIYEAPVTKDSRNILNHASPWSNSSSVWGTLFYVETSSGWRVLRFTPDPNREQKPMTVTYQCYGNSTCSSCWTVGGAAPEETAAKKKRAPKK